MDLLLFPEVTGFRGTSFSVSAAAAPPPFVSPSHNAPVSVLDAAASPNFAPPSQATTNDSTKKSFLEAVLGAKPVKKIEEYATPMKPLSIPRFEGGNVVVEVEDEDYRQGVEELKFSVIGKTSAQFGEPTIKSIRVRLEEVWNFADFRIVPMGNATFHIILYNLEDQSTVLAKGSVPLNPGILRIHRWMPGFDFANMKTTSTQVWVRIFGIPLEYRKVKQNLFNISAGVGTPLKIDPRTLQLELGIYARILVEIDFTRELPNRLLVKRIDGNKNVKDDFFVQVKYEWLPKFCNGCSTFGHLLSECWRIQGNKTKQGTTKYMGGAASRNFNREGVNKKVAEQGGAETSASAKEQTTGGENHGADDAARRSATTDRPGHGEDDADRRSATTDRTDRDMAAPVATEALSGANTIENLVDYNIKQVSRQVHMAGTNPRREHEEVGEKNPVVQTMADSQEDESVASAKDKNTNEITRNQPDRQGNKTGSNIMEDFEVLGACNQAAHNCARALDTYPFENSLLPADANTPVEPRFVTAAFDNITFVGNENTRSDSTSTEKSLCGDSLESDPLSQTPPRVQNSFSALEMEGDIVDTVSVEET